MPNETSWQCATCPVAEEEITDDQHSYPFCHAEDAPAKVAAQDASARELS